VSPNADARGSGVGDKRLEGTKSKTDVYRYCLHLVYDNFGAYGLNKQAKQMSVNKFEKKLLINFFLWLLS
jgi:hypothetical protein